MSNVREMYVTNASINGAKYVLMVMEDGQLKLNWYHGLSKLEEMTPTMVKKSEMGHTYIEYGSPNLFGTKPNISFMSGDGKLDSRWEKIK